MGLRRQHQGIDQGTKMQRVLIIAENSLQQERLCVALKFDKSVQLTTANLRQVNPRNVRTFKQVDLIVLEDTSEQGDPRTTEYLLSSLKTTGLPIVLLPSIEARLNHDREPLVLNLTEKTVAQPGLVALINKIRAQYASKTPSAKAPVNHKAVESAPSSSGLTPLANESRLKTLQPPIEHPTNASLPTELAQSSSSPPDMSKVMYGLATMGRIAKQLREPLSNMNLAIHMLSKAESIEERDRYVKLLRQEYQRELQLVNELESLHNSLETSL
ncbi:MAG: hypothetical protein ACFB0G_08065 [Leptolyngbyaceae cyanobacterium]